MIFFFCGCVCSCILLFILLTCVFSVLRPFVCLFCFFFFFARTVGCDGAINVYHVPRTCGIKRPVGNDAETSVVEQKQKRQQKARRTHRRSQSMDMLPSVAAAAAIGSSPNANSFLATSPVLKRKGAPAALATTKSLSSAKAALIVRPMIADTAFMRQVRHRSRAWILSFFLFSVFCWLS
jgi:hypothetical protein